MGTKGVGLDVRLRRPYTDYRLYIGDGGDNFLKFDGSAVTIGSNQTDAITIKSGGGILLDGGGTVHSSNVGALTEFSLGGSWGVQTKGWGLSLAPRCDQATDGNIIFHHEHSFAEVEVTTKHGSTPKRNFYSDAFKASISANLEITSVEDLDPIWVDNPLKTCKVTFTGDTLVAGAQIGNLVDPADDWSTPWHEFGVIIDNGTNWVHVTRGVGIILPEIGEHFDIKGRYAVAATSKVTYQAPPGFYFTSGNNMGYFAVYDSHNSGTGEVTIKYEDTPYDVEAGDLYKGYDHRAFIEYSWNNKRMMIFPYVANPDRIDFYIGVGNSGNPSAGMFESATINTDSTTADKNTIILNPTFDNTAYIHIRPRGSLSGFPSSRAHLKIEQGNLEMESVNHSPTIQITGEDDATLDPQITFRTGATPAARFTLGVDNSDSDKFKINSGASLADTSLFEMTSAGQLYITDRIYWLGDTDTYIGHTSNQIFLHVGGGTRCALTPTVTYFYTSVTIGDTTIGDHGIEFDSDPDSDGEWCGSWVTMQVDANTVGFGSALHMDTDGNWIEADADGTATMPCMALALETGTGSKKVLMYGFIKDTGWSWNEGAILFVSDTVGTLQEAAPSGTGDQIQSVGIAISATVVFFNPSHLLVEHD